MDMARNSNFTMLTIVKLLLLLLHIYDVTGHGGMIEPPMRSVAWKYGFDAPVNYDWMGLFCGGLHVFQESGGKCGLCGDPYNGPFENDKGGVYDTGIIVRHYPAGLKEIEVKVEMTAHHKGHFQFKLCPNNEHSLTQSCLDRFPLVIREAREQGDPYKYYPPKEPKLNEIHVLLPPDVTCDRCVLQWTYTAGNSVGQEADGGMCLGCGLQETFVNCADISIGGTVDKMAVAGSPSTDDSVMVLEQRADFEDITSKASGVLNDLQHDDDNTESRPVFDDTFIPRHSGNNFVPTVQNSDSRMFTPPSGNWNSVTRIPPIRSSSTGTHVVIRDNMGVARVTLPPNIHNMAAIRARESLHNMGWQSQGHYDFMQGQGQRFPNHVARFHGNVMPQLMGQFGPTISPPPSRVPSQNSNFNRFVNNDVISDSSQGRASFPGSVGEVSGNIRNQQPNLNNQAVGQQPSREFVQQMTELRRMFPNIREWRRGDGMSTSNQPVRHAPHLDTHDFTVREIAQQVPSLPSDIGPRQDNSPLTNQRINPFMNQHMQNWYPTSHFFTQEPGHRLNQVQNNSPLPRRIEVQTMAIAQHLLRKYPQLKGRVFLSHEAHLRNQYAHMTNKYARRQNWFG